MKFEYVKRTCKSNRQALLEELLLEELEYLRIKFFPWQRRPFLYNKIEIGEEKLREKEALGMYKKIEKNKIEILHKISIDKILILSCQKFSTAWIRRSYGQELRQVLRHELIHAFVEERYGHVFKDLDFKHADASPIFLSVLVFAEGCSHHPCFFKFTCTEIYKKAKQYRNNGSFKELDDYIFNLLRKYNAVAKKLENLSNNYIKNKDKDIKTVVNSFMFSPDSKCVGLDKIIELHTEDVYKFKNKLHKSTNTVRTWAIGCNVTPERLEELYYRKQDVKAKDYRIEKNYYRCFSKENIQKINVYKKGNMH